MKHIFKKLHLGSNHDPNRSNEVPNSTSATSPSCASDHRAATGQGQNSGATPPSPSSSSPSPSQASNAAGPVPSAMLATANRTDYFSSEEEFQVQLALAISASNSEFRDDPEKDQIRTATLLSLGGHRIDSERDKDEVTAEALARQYWVSSGETLRDEMVKFGS